jgi:hypothetical protein
MEPWISKHVVPFLRKRTPFSGDGLKYIKLTSSSGLSVLKMFYSQERPMVQAVSALVKDRKKKQVLVIPLTLDEVKKTEEGILALKGIEEASLRKTHPNLRFLFVLGGDCALMWGAQWKRDSGIELLSLDNGELFGKEVFSRLNKMGAVPDRLEVNKFLAEAAVEEAYEKALEGLQIEGQSVSLAPKETAWSDLMQQVGSFPLAEDPGSRRYRDAILQWHTSFFEMQGLLPFASPLLYSQVGPYLSENGGITQWSKAYQNLAEIVMFCLQTHPQLCSQLDFSSVVLQSLDSHKRFQSFSRSVGLFPYGMSPVFHILKQVLERPEFQGKTVATASISQGYFETLDMLEKMQERNYLTFEKKETLDALGKVPDILIADIHPNNAAKKTLFQNDVAGWVEGKLQADPAQKIILLLDLTLNHISDLVVQKTLSRLSSFVQAQLEIFAIQSLAKLAQMGADNFSGGMAIHLGGKEGAPSFFPPIPAEKAAFFGWLFRDFKDLTKAYIDHVRENTDWMYQTLSKRLAEAAGEGRMRYCAAEVTLNGDENTVYVAIGFAPLFQVLKLAPSDETEGKKEKRESIASILRQSILEWAAKRGLPMTGRQSFGFSLSNMSGVCDTIRFSIGVENLEILEGYVQHIVDVCNLLSKYSMDEDPVDMSKFRERLSEVFLLAGGEKPFAPIEVTLREQGYDKYGDETYEDVGKASICFEEGALSLRIPQKDSRPLIVEESEIGVYNQWGASCSHPWTFSERCKLFYQILQDPGFLYVVRGAEGTYAIGGTYGRNISFRDGGKISDSASGATPPSTLFG